MQRESNKPHAIVQNCWVVPDIKAAMRHWLNLGYGPFLTLDLELPGITYRGQPSSVPLNFSMAFTQAGELNIELIQQHSSGPSAYRDVYGPNEGGFHHVCWICADYALEKKALLKRGFAVAHEACMGELNFCYVDVRAEFGCMLELVPDVPMIRNMYQAVRDASIGWDGSDPIRQLTL
ncbi:MAG: VOC family protein [Georgfuchsia sp.]